MRPARDADVDIGGKRYCITSDDDYLEHIRNGFEPDMVRLFQTLARSTDVVCDVGANIGCTAILFAGLCAHVHAFEPSPTTFGFLQKNIARSGLANVSLHNIGLGMDPGGYTLTFSPADRSGGFVSNQTRTGDGYTVEPIEIRRLDDAVGSLNPPRADLIKLDVEGFEGHVLRGATRTLAAFRPLVVLELNHWCLNAFQRTSIPDFFDLLRSLFPILLAVDGTSYMDLHDEGDSYTVMYWHILRLKYPNIVAAFDEAHLGGFRHLYRHVFDVN